jgi:hypothetical protein
MTLRTCWRPFAAAVAFIASVGASSAAAQTVVVRSAAPQSAAELVINADRVATATVGPNGIATLSVDASGQRKMENSDVHVFVDVCGSLHRVLLVETGHDPAPLGASCQRRSVPDLFGVGSRTSLVVDVSSDTPSVLIRQGPPPREWIYGVEAGRTGVVPGGIIVFGGVSGARFGNIIADACGDAASCSGGRSKGALTGGATLWITRWLGAEAAFMQAGELTASGDGTLASGGTYNFKSIFQSRMLTVTGKVGAPLGRFRLYGKAGVDRTWATLSTTQTTTATPESAAATETFALRSHGWGLLVGGGADVWFGRRLGMYVEGGRAALKGGGKVTGDSSLDDSMLYLTLGLRLHIAG